MGSQSQTRLSAIESQRRGHFSCRLWPAWQGPSFLTCRGCSSWREVEDATDSLLGWGPSAWGSLLPDPPGTWIRPCSFRESWPCWAHSDSGERLMEYALLKDATNFPIVTQWEDCFFPANLIPSYHTVEGMGQNLIAWAMDIRFKQQMPAVGRVGGNREQCGLGQTSALAPRPCRPRAHRRQAGVVGPLLIMQSEI